MSLHETNRIPYDTDSLRIPRVEKNPSNYLLLHTNYQRPRKETDWSDSIDLIIKEISTGIKFVHTIVNPTMDVYISKTNRKYNADYEKITNTTRHNVPYRNIDMEVAKLAGDDYVNAVVENNRNGNRRANRNIHRDFKRVFGSDYDIESYIRCQWLLKYGPPSLYSLTKAMFDIEVDTYKLGRFPKSGERPVTSISLGILDEETVYSFFLKDDSFTTIENFYEERVTKKIESIKEKYKNMDNFFEPEIKVRIYTSEVELIADFIKLLNMKEPDICGIWNMDFDIPYLIERLKVLGESPEEHFYNSKFQNKYAWYSKSRAFVTVKKSSRFYVAMPTIFIDQMVAYAANRIGQGTLRSNKLDYISSIELGEGKVEFNTDINMASVCYLDYDAFFEYSIVDVLIMMALEKKVGDYDTMFSRSLTNFTAINHVYKQTRFLENRAYVEYYLQGLIIGNNPNIDYSISFDSKTSKSKDDEDEAKYPGGIVSDPTLMDSVGMIVRGYRSPYIHSWIIDFDAESMYPHVIQAFNISKGTMIGKVIVDESISKLISTGTRLLQDPDSYQSVRDTGTEMMEDYTAGNDVVFCEKWLGYPNTLDLIEDLESKLMEGVS